MYLKLMGDENAPDGDARKAHQIVSDVISVKFVRVGPEQGPRVGCFAFTRFANGDEGEYELLGNAYVMNDKGDTIDHFGPAQLFAHEFPSRAPVIDDPGLAVEIEELLDIMDRRPPTTANYTIRKALERMRQHTMGSRPDHLTTPYVTRTT